MRVYQHPTTKNFGDTLSVPILSGVTGRAVHGVDKSVRGKVVAVGSVMHCMRAGDVVWGTGVQQDRRYSGAGVRFLAVRGPLSRSCIDNADVPPVYGDPAMLLPVVYDPPVKKKHALGVVPHYFDASIAATKHPNALQIDVLDDWRHVVRQIKSCRRVIATSLHGVIVAEAYGVPVIWHGSYSGRLISPNLKFQDYFLGTGRPVQRPGVVDTPDRKVWDSRCRGLMDASHSVPR